MHSIEVKDIIDLIEINKLLKDKSYLNEILIKGSKKADLIAKNNLQEIYEIIGLTKFT